MATQRMNLHAWLHKVHRGDFTPGPVNNAAIILQRIVSLLICLKKSQEIQGILGKKRYSIETKRSADYFLPQGSDGQDSTTHHHAHQAEGNNMLNIIDQLLF